MRLVQCLVLPYSTSVIWAGKLRALGKPKPNAVKFFCSIELITLLSQLAWSPLLTNTLAGGSSYFSDQRWTNFPARFCRLRSP